ncbi:MAG: hypothetical protein HY866_00625 [Chloroflexi bacterium]|nr:hypothetical protein [Chloroflexota bacterium]
MRTSITWFFRLVAVFLVVITFLTIAPVNAADGVTINSQQVNCDSVVVTYTVTGGAAEEVAQLGAYRPDDTQVGSASGPGVTGQHTVTITLSPSQAAGTSVFVYIRVGTTSANSSAQPCSAGEGPVGDPWDGYTDERLNPSMDEYYSIWCKYDQVEIWRSVPTSAMFPVPLIQLVNLADGGTLDAGNGMTINRSGDIITVFGSNGNLAPASGSKSFSLSECITRNGGEPEQPINETAGSAPEPQNEDIGLEYCMENYSDMVSLLACMFTYNGGLRSPEGLVIWMLQFCSTGPAIVIVPAGLWVRRQRRTRS